MPPVPRPGRAAARPVTGTGRWERVGMAVLAVLVAGTVALSADRVTDESRRAMEKEVHAAEQLAADERASQLGLALEAARARTEVSASYDVVRIAVEARTGELLRAALEQGINGPGITGGTITDSTGGVIASVGRIDDVSPDDQDRFRPAPDRRDGFVTFSEPVRSADGAQVVGWLHQQFSLRGLAPQLVQPIPYQAGAVTLVDDRGEVLLTTADRPVRRVETPALLDLVRTGERATISFESLELERHRVAALAPVEGTDLMAIIGADVDAASRPASELVFRLTVVLAITLVVVGLLLGGLLYLLARTRRRYLAERQAANELAVTDPLTGLANRRAFDEAVADAEHRAGTTAVVMIDLDHLKAINDTGGHSAGDVAIRQVAQAIRSSVRPGDLVSRIGGDEFAVLLPDTPLQQAEQTAARATAAVRQLTISGYGSLSASAGTASGPNPHIQTTLELADRRLYDAKRTRQARPSIDERLRFVIERHGLDGRTRR